MLQAEFRQGGRLGDSNDRAMADFPPELLSELNQLGLIFMDEFEEGFPGRGKGRTPWR
jgi:hypothetical protein